MLSNLLGTLLGRFRFGKPATYSEVLEVLAILRCPEIPFPVLLIFPSERILRMFILRIRNVSSFLLHHTTKHLYSTTTKVIQHKLAISEGAAKQIQTLTKNKSTRLRVAVDGGYTTHIIPNTTSGCHGFQYLITLDSSPPDPIEDLVFEEHGASGMSLSHLTLFSNCRQG
jgi:hypothetical protein